MKTRLLLTFLSAWIGLLSGCRAFIPTSTPVTVTFGHPQILKEYYQEMVSAFHKEHPSITVELRAMNAGQTDGLDAFIVDSLSFLTYQANGTMLNLRPLVDTSFDAGDQEDFYPGALAAFSTPEGIWALPSGADPVVLYFNKDMFDQARLPYPTPDWTWEDFLSAANRLSKPEEGIFGFGLYGIYLELVPVVWIYQNDGKLFDNLQNAHYMVFDDPANIAAMEWYADLLFNYHVMPTPDQTASLFGNREQGVQRAILQGKIGMWMARFSERGGKTWPVEWSMPWGMAALPRGRQDFSIGFVIGHAIAANTKHIDASWEWIRFLSDQATGLAVPARQSLAKSTAFTQIVGSEIATAGRESMEKTVLINVGLMQFIEPLELFFQAVTQITAGKLTPSEALQNAQEQYNR